MDIASLISYPMLPEFEKVIPKPLKKRYRDLFEGHDDDQSAIGNLENIPANITGKLKVKWREKYENLNGYESVERSDVDLEAKNVAGCRTTAVGKYSKAKKDTKIANAAENTTFPTVSQSHTDTLLETTADPPVVRKLERTCKGLIYQKYMASTYSWNRKEKKEFSKVRKSNKYKVWRYSVAKDLKGKRGRFEMLTSKVF